jgi:ribonuclease P protein component
VQRNRARRVIREAWRSLSSRVLVGVDLVMVAGSGAAEVGMHDIAQELEALLIQAGVIE